MNKIQREIIDLRFSKGLNYEQTKEVILKRYMIDEDKFEEECSRLDMEVIHYEIEIT